MQIHSGAHCRTRCVMFKCFNSFQSLNGLPCSRFAVCHPCESHCHMARWKTNEHHINVMLCHVIVTFVMCKTTRHLDFCDGAGKDLAENCGESAVVWVPLLNFASACSWDADDPPRFFSTPGSPSHCTSLTVEKTQLHGEVPHWFWILPEPHKGIRTEIFRWALLHLHWASWFCFSRAWLCAARYRTRTGSEVLLAAALCL
jgi:hypothetical protein